MNTHEITIDEAITRCQTALAAALADPDATPERWPWDHTLESPSDPAVCLGRDDDGRPGAVTHATNANGYVTPVGVDADGAVYVDAVEVEG